MQVDHTFIRYMLNCKTVCKHETTPKEMSDYITTGDLDNY